MSVIFYANILEELISSFWIWHIPDQEPPSLPSSFLLDLKSGNNQRFHTYSVEGAEFFFVGSLPCSAGFFSGSSGFLPPQKPTFWIPIRPGNSGQEEPTRGMSAAKLFNPIIIVIVVIFVFPRILPICYVLARTAVSILQILEFLQTLLSCICASFRIALLIIKMCLWGYSLCNGASMLNFIIIIILAVKRKDASLNKILTKRNRVACHYHSLK